MTVISEGPLCLKIHLNRIELKKYFISYDKIVFSDPGVKKTLFFLLDTASVSFKFQRNGNILIKVSPTHFGGCIFKFTCTPSIETITTSNSIENIKRKKTIYTFRFNNFENLILLSLAYINKENSESIDSSVYYIKKNYYLITELFNNQMSLALLINEYSNYCARGKYPAELVMEYGKCLINQNALETVGNSFKVT